MLDAARDLVLGEGYASVTARRVASEAGLKPQLVHYYFASMDDLFAGLIRRDAEIGRSQLARAASSAQPLRALWDLSMSPTTTPLSMEYMALANHRKAIASVVSEVAEEFRTAQLNAFRHALDEVEIAPCGIPVETLLLSLEGLARLIVMERNVGNTALHDGAIALIEGLLVQIEGKRKDPSVGV